MPQDRLNSSIIEGLKHKDPKLYQYLNSIRIILDDVQNELDPLVRASLTATIIGALPGTIVSFTYTIQSNGIRFDWEADSNAVQYEIRKGASFDAGTQIIVTSQLSAIIEPISPLGTSHKYWIKSINSGGVYSANATELDVALSNIENIVISSRVIDNNVLLNWSVPTAPFTIAYYNLYKNAVFFGRVTGTFQAFFESLGGTNTYNIIAVDIAGNVGGDNTIVLVVSTPPDYVLLSAQTSALNGTKVNVLREVVLGVPKLFCCINLTQTWEQHFVNNSWTTAQDQINAGFPYYAQPTLLTGTYTETFDYGIVLGSVIANLDWSTEIIAGNVSVNPSFEFSANGTDWSSPVGGSSAFGTNVRYVRITITFTGTDTTSLIWFYNFQIFLDVKREMDSGSITANAADSGGTTVLFNKAYKDVDSITLIANSLEPIYPIYDFVDIPNPVSFKVLIFDSAGKRITYLISWKARGIV